MKLRLTALVLCAFVVFALFSSCSLVLSKSGLSESSAISDNEESQIISDNTTILGEAENSELSSDNDINKSDLSQNQSILNNSSKVNNSPSSQNGSEIKTGTSSKTDTSSVKQNSSLVTSTSTSSSTSLSKPTQNTAIMPIRPIRPDEYYGWQYLKENASETVQRAYQVFVEKFGNYEKKITFDFNITGVEASLAFDCYKSDYPQHFWVRDASYRSSSKTGYVNEFILIKIPFNGKMDMVQELEKQMLQEAKKVLSKVNGSMSVLERERIIHDTIVENTKYDSTLKAENSHNLCGVLVDGTAVCEGYANAFQYLMRQAGIQCIPVRGEFNGGSHEWNMVKLNGEYYHIDVTADDPIMNNGKSDILKFEYFNLPESEIEKDHVIKDNAYDIPSATSGKSNFYKVFGLESENISIDFVAKSMAFSANNGYEYAHMKFTGISTGDAVKYISENYKEILNKANQSITDIKLLMPQYLDYTSNAEKGIVSIKLLYE